jgi:hypothetical protein
MHRHLISAAITLTVLLALLILVGPSTPATAPAAAPAPAPGGPRTDDRASRSYERPHPSVQALYRLPAKPKPKPKVQVLARKLVKPPTKPKRTFIPTPRRSTAVNWDAIAKCESGNHWNHHTATDGKYWGGLQMDMSFWRSYHGDRDFAARPDLATRAQQIAVAERAYRTRGLSPWPTCGAYG